MRIRKQLLTWLPGGECGRCGEADCAVFTAKIESSHYRPHRCPFLTPEQISEIERLQFAHFYRQNAPLLHNWLRRKGVYWADSDDLVQEAFFWVWKKRGAVLDGKSKSYLLGTAMRLLRNHYRKSQRRRHLWSAPYERKEAVCAWMEDPEPYVGLARGEQRQRVEALIGHLPRRMTQIIRALYLEGKSRKETADWCGITHSTVLKTEAEAIKKLRLLRSRLEGRGEWP